MSNYVNVFNVQRFCVNDGPGVRTTVFFKGCPLDCVWCHNPESKSTKSELSYIAEKCALCGECERVCPAGVHSFSKDLHKINRELCTHCGACEKACNFSALELLGKKYTVEEIMREISKDEDFYESTGGVTFSGGEPFLQSDALLELLKKCKERGYSTCIETSGATAKENIKEAAKYCDLFLYDCKETNEENHKRYIGCTNVQILENLRLLDTLGARVILRCPIIPKVNDRADHFEKIAELAESLSCIISVELMLYHPLGISKSERIGKECGFCEEKFLSKEEACKYVEYIKERTKKDVRIG